MAIDDLTGLEDGSKLEEFLGQTIPSNRGYRVALVMVDIVKFKDYNKRYGLPQGDQALCSVAQHLSSIRDKKLAKVARIDDKDYFAVVFENIGKEELLERAEQIKQELEAMEMPRKGPEPAPDDGYKRVGIDAVCILYVSGEQTTPGEFVGKAKAALDDKSLRTGEARFIE